MKQNLRLFSKSTTDEAWNSKITWHNQYIKKIYFSGFETFKSQHLSCHRAISPNFDLKCHLLKWLKNFTFSNVSFANFSPLKRKTSPDISFHILKLLIMTVISALCEWACPYSTSKPNSVNSPVCLLHTCWQKEGLMKAWQRTTGYQGSDK